MMFCFRRQRLCWILLHPGVSTLYKQIYDGLRCQVEVRGGVASQKIMHTSPFVLLLSEAVLVLECFSSNTRLVPSQAICTSTNARQSELPISGGFQLAARLICTARYPAFNTRFGCSAS